MYLVQTSGADMAELASMMETGTLRPLVYKTFRFDELRAAHTEVELGRTVGKVIVTV
jgi:NADPH:quinone reductase-like Zn-dependent oxidoreductase